MMGALVWVNGGRSITQNCRRRKWFGEDVERSHPTGPRCRCDSKWSGRVGVALGGEGGATEQGSGLVLSEVLAGDRE